MKTKSSVALVTGASSGIGEATAKRLAAAGYKVYGTSRRGAQASGQASGQAFEMLPLDVTSDASVEVLVEEVLRREGRIDLLVNNAGFGVAPGGAEESSIEQARAIFETNFFGLIRMTRAVLPHMRQQGSGRIINMSSVLGFLPMPYGALYAATKHAVEGYSESLDHELRTRGIRVSVIEPAYTKTPFDANFLEPDSKLDAYREARIAVNQRVKEVMATAEEPNIVADVVLKAASAKNPKLRYTAGVLAGRLRLLRTYAPAGLVDAGIRKDLRLDAVAASTVHAGANACPPRQPRRFPPLHPGRIGLRRLGVVPSRAALQRLDRPRDIDVDHRIELLGQLREEVVTLAFGLGPVDHADRTFEPRLAQQRLHPGVVGAAAAQRRERQQQPFDPRRVHQVLVAVRE
jgi:NAD(P)-dependent dehydrogenase (short-subunit alcohol dehydrogenase family)